MKQVLKEMHSYGENAKMDNGDGGRFIGNRASELHETAQACFHRPCTIPHKTVCQKDAWFSTYGKNKFGSMDFCLKAFCMCLHGMT